MFHPTDDLRIKWTKVVLPPVFLEEEMPDHRSRLEHRLQARKEITQILRGDDRACWWSSAPAPSTTPRRRASMPGC